ncbi:MAG: hypothetical protein KKH08_00680 [Candidatus Omnitrophica bacterium]|nr:hypothetical protein [Candidatus Omnitrophota bacterium]
MKVDFGKGKVDPLYAEDLSDLWQDRMAILAKAKNRKIGSVNEVTGVLDSIIEMYDKTLPSMDKPEIIVLDTRAGNAGEQNYKFFKKRGFEVVDMDEVLGVKGVPEADMASLIAEKKDVILSILKQKWHDGNKQIVLMLNAHSDPYMRRGIWDPSKKEAMQACVQLVKLVNDNLEGDMPKVFGGVYDGDADRFGAVKENGEAIEAFEMTIPYYQRFLLDPQNMDAIAKIVKSGGEPIWLACDVRANSKLEKVLKRTNDIIKNKYGLRQDVIKAVYINTGYPPQLSFVEWRIAKMREYIENTPELKNDGQFTEDFLHLAQTYYTAEASGHNFFHAAPGNLERPCDCGMAALVAEINIRETAAGIEAKYADMGDKEEYTLVDIYDSFPGTFTSSELRLFIPNSIKIETAHRLGKWLKDKYSADLKEITFAEPVKEGNMLLQPAEDGFITVAGYKAQLKNGDSILIRWSNTGEQLQLLFEGNTLESLVAKMTEVEQRLKEEEGVGLIVTDLSKDIESIRKQLNNESTRTMASKYKPTNKDIEQYAQVIGDPTEASHIVEHYTSIAGASKILPFVFGNGQGRMINKKLLEEIEKGNIIVSIAEMPNDHQVYLKGVNKKKDDPRGKLASNMSITDKNRREGMLSKLQSEDMIGQMARLYGKSFEEAEALNASKIAKIGFETKKDGSKVNRLGWTPENLKWLLNNPDKIDQVLKDAEYIRSKYKYVIFCGMGGSGLSVQTVKTTFGEKDIKIYSLRTTDPAVIKHILENEISKDAGSLQNALAETLVIPISKSGTTKETVSHKEYSEELFAQEGININDHMRVITDKGSPMDTGDYTQREIQLNGRSDIGGRFTSPTTNIFLLPLALVAPDKVKDVLEIALKMNEIGDINKDDFIKLGAYLYDMALKDKDKVTYMAPEELKDFPMWSEQIIEESLGKDGKGVTAFYGEDISKDSLKNVNENDRVFLRINIAGKETNKEFTDYLKNNNYPVFDIDVDSIDSIGGLMLGFARTVATVAYLWDICFVDQPAVEGYKDATREVMAALKPGEKVNVPESWKKVSYGKLNLYYDRLMKVGAITEDEISKEVESLGVAMDDAPAVYAAVINILKGKPGFEAMEISSYGKMTGNMETILKKARKNIFTDGLKMASKLGEGPDKNHSYHQNIEAGKDMWLSTYFMPLQVEQPEALEYDDNLIKAQTIGTVNSIVKQGRKVTLITFDSTIKEAEGDLADFFGEVESYLSKDKIKPNNASNESLIDEVNKAFSEGKYGDALKVIDKAIQSEIAFGRNEYREIEKAKKRIMSKIIVIAASKVIQDRGVIAKKTTPESAVVIVAMDEKEYVAVKDIKGVNVKALNGEWVNKYKELDKARILNLSKDQTDVLKDQLMIYNDVIDLGSLNSHIIDKAIIRSLASNV